MILGLKQVLPEAIITQMLFIFCAMDTSHSLMDAAAAAAGLHAVVLLLLLMQV